MYQGDTSSYVMYGALDTSERSDNCNGHGGGNDYDRLQTSAGCVPVCWHKLL
jgi:hypothetical protein